MIAMSTHSVPSWRTRVGHAVKSMPAKGWVALAVAGAVVLASGLIHPALPGFLLMGLGCSVAVGHKN